MRHFYSILARTGDQAATPGSKSEEKVKKILLRLDTIHENLKKLKNEVGSSDEQSFDAASVNAQVKCISDIMQLRQQAYNVWKRHLSTFHGR